MQYQTKIINALLMLLGLWGLSACSEEKTQEGALASSSESELMQVYKSPTCGCCVDWITHVEQAGMKTAVQHPQDMGALKAEKGVAPAYRSCHTAVNAQGYVFEGHVPAKHIRAFLDNPPEDAIGLAVPGMPVGSPGMEMGDEFSPYQVLLLQKDGSARVFATVQKMQEQYE